MSVKTHLDRLGLDEFSTIDDVNRAYRALAKKCHPDTSGKDGTEFRLLTESYEALKKNHVPRVGRRARGGAKFDAGATVFRSVVDVLNYPYTYVLPLDSNVLDRDVALVLRTENHGISGFKDEYVITIRAGEVLPKLYYMRDVEVHIKVKTLVDAGNNKYERMAT